jgi:prepilin-type N-terminal cleavage/methylation domain-containing protein/prepilin-type processing-associated H-X9-DG protein
MTEYPPRRRAGFTLIELLVVIAIIAVLIALLLPAVQAAREAARRAQCVNNLFQLSTALQNYESSHEVLPPGVVNPSGPISNSPKGYHVSWLVQILPYMEQKNAFKKINFNKGVYDDANATVRGHVISSYLCPSDPARASSPGVASTNYAACHNDAEAPIDVKNNGVFYLNSSTRLDDVTDGTSCTIFLGERKLIGPATLGWMSGTNATLRNAGTPINGPGVVGPNPNDDDAPPPAEGAGATPANQIVGGFSSFHSGGSNFAFGDGSIRFLKNSMSAKIYHRLANRSDGDLISADQY